jgi:hypothetical protein
VKILHGHGRTAPRRSHSHQRVTANKAPSLLSSLPPAARWWCGVGGLRRRLQVRASQPTQPGRWHIHLASNPLKQEVAPKDGPACVDGRLVPRASPSHMRIPKHRQSDHSRHHHVSAEEEDNRLAEATRVSCDTRCAAPFSQSAHSGKGCGPGRRSLSVIYSTSVYSSGTSVPHDTSTLLRPAAQRP